MPGIGNPLVAFRCASDLMERLEARKDEGQANGEVARRDLTRLYQMYEVTLYRLQLTEAEASLLVDALNGLWADPWHPGALSLQVRDALELEGLGEKWGVNSEVLREKVADLTPGEELAVIDAAERFWRDPNAAPLGEMLRRVGLVPTPRRGLARERDEEGEEWKR